VVEVLSTGTARFDRSTKLEWYRRYGIVEYWMVDPDSWSIEVVDCAHPDAARVFTEEATLRSPTLSRLRLRVARVFED
jgi:Uma2 family endonuclease